MDSQIEMDLEEVDEVLDAHAYDDVGFFHTQAYVSLHRAPGIAKYQALTNEIQVPIHSAHQQKNDPQELIALKPRDSDEAREFTGTQWKNAQFLFKVRDKEANQIKKPLPLTWTPKATGVNIRVKFRGSSIAPKLVIEFTLLDNGRRVHRGFLIFSPSEHIIGYNSLDRTSPPMQQAQKKRGGNDDHQEGEEFQRQNYFIITFTTTGGIGQGLDVNYLFMDDEDRQVLSYARQLSLNFAADANRVKQVAIRMNAHWVDSTAGRIKNRRKLDEHQRLHRYVVHFKKMGSRSSVHTGPSTASHPVSGVLSLLAVRSKRRATG